MDRAHYRLDINLRLGHLQEVHLSRLQDQICKQIFPWRDIGTKLSDMLNIRPSDKFKGE